MFLSEARNSNILFNLKSSYDECIRTAWKQIQYSEGDLAPIMCTFSCLYGWIWKSSNRLSLLAKAQRTTICGRWAEDYVLLHHTCILRLKLGRTGTHTKTISIQMSTVEIQWIQTWWQRNGTCLKNILKLLFKNSPLLSSRKPGMRSWRCGETRMDRCEKELCWEDESARNWLRNKRRPADGQEKVRSSKRSNVLSAGGTVTHGVGACVCRATHIDVWIPQLRAAMGGTTGWKGPLLTVAEYDDIARRHCRNRFQVSHM